jgi:hypothetical protein
MRCLRNAGTLLFLASLLGSAVLQAQDNRIEVLVEQIAGSSIYLRAGTDDGIAVDDTLLVLDSSDSRSIGALVVTGATASRSVVAFLSDPFPITRGTMLRLVIGSAAQEDEADPEPSADQGETRVATPTMHPQVSGRLSFQLNSLGSTTSWESNEDVSVSRRFTTPALLLRLAVRDLPGGLEFSSNLRGAYRHSSGDLVEPAHSMRVYQASVRKSFESIPVRVQVGRFYNRYETYSGYWDGVLMRYGTENLGAGVVAGFEPRRSNEGVTTDVPKYTAFIDVSRVGKRIGYFADISFHRQVPGDDMPTQTSIGWSQHLTAGRTRLSTDAQVHRDPRDNSWTLTRLHANGSVPVSRSVSVLGRLAFDKPTYLFQAFDLFSFERQQAGVGLRYWDRGGNASVHVTANRVNKGDFSYSISPSFNIAKTKFLELGFHGAASLWVLEDTRVVSLVGGVDRMFGRVQSRGSYRFYKTVGVNTSILSHTIDAALIFPMSERIYATLTGRAQHGANLSSNNIFVSLWTSF